MSGPAAHRADDAGTALTSWWADVFVGAVSNGVNLSTLLLLNVVVGAALGSILLLLLVSWHSNPELVPHVVVLLLLGLGLWASINWFVSNVGLVDPRSQHEQVFGSAADHDSDQAPDEGKRAGMQQPTPGVPDAKKDR